MECFGILLVFLAEAGNTNNFFKIMDDRKAKERGSV